MSLYYKDLYDTREQAQNACDKFLASWSYVYSPKAKVVEFDEKNENERLRGKFWAKCERAGSCD